MSSNADRNFPAVPLTRRPSVDVRHPLPSGVGWDAKRPMVRGTP